MAASPSDIAILAAAVIGSGGVGAILGALFKPSSKADLIKVAQDAAQAVIEDLRSEIDRLQERIESLEADNETCRGENRELQQSLRSLESALRDAGVPIPARELPGTFVAIEGGRATVLKPTKRKPQI